MVSLLLQRGANLYGTGFLNYTALRMAVEMRHLAAIPLLVERDRALPSVTRAVLEDRPQTVVDRLRRGLNPNRRDVHGMFPLAWAAALSQPELVRALLSFGADANMVGRDGYTPLTHAAKHGDAEATELLLDAGAAPDLGETARKAGGLYSSPRRAGETQP